MRESNTLNLGDTFSVEIDGKVYSDRVESVRYTGGTPAIYRELNRWQWFLRQLTPKRWRRSLLVHPAEPMTVTIGGKGSGGSGDPVGKMIAQLNGIKTAWDTLKEV